jgi:PAS domain S-box-containing protein
VDVFAPDRRGEVAARIRETHEKGSLTWESEHVRADGSVFPVLIDATAIADEDGNASLRAVYVRDLTATKRIERSVYELFERAADGIFLADLDGTYTDVNAAGCKMLGYDRDELVGRTISDLIAADQLPKLAAARERLLGGAPEVDEWQLRRSDGTWVPVEISARILPDGRWIAFVRNITIRKRVQEELAASEARFRLTVAMADEGIISHDEAGTILIFNEGAERIFGWRAEEVLGKSLEVLLPPWARDAHREQIRRFAESGVTARPMANRNPVHAMRRDGEEFMAQASISQLVDRGRRILTVMMRDVSEETRARRREQLLGELGSVLVAGPSVDATLAAVSRLAVGYVADLCAIDALTEGGARVVHVEARDPSRAALAEELRSRLQRDPSARALERAGRPDEPELVSALDLEAHASSPAHRAWLEAAALRSAAVAPMVARGRLHGSLAFFSAGRAFDARDLHLAVDVAGRTAMALENAELNDALVRANVDLRARVRELEEAQAKIRTLSGLLPLCAWCGRIHDEADDRWEPLERYVAAHSETEFTHGICPECVEKKFTRRST